MSMKVMQYSLSFGSNLQLTSKVVVATWNWDQVDQDAEIIGCYSSGRVNEF